LSKQFTYNKQQKVKSRKELDNLFKNGKSFLIFPLKVFYFFNDKENENLVRCGVGVSKKHYAKAVDRNRIKRLMREGFRLNKLPLEAAIELKQLTFFMLFIDKTMPLNYAAIEDKAKLVIAKLIKRYNEDVVAKNT
jgi:ribonuclease P protein component